jgi:hypothetical protein
MLELIKTGNQRSEAQSILNECHSVQFFLNGKLQSYLFKLRNKSSSKPYILVKQDSFVFKELKVGDVLDMEYHRPESLGGGKTFRTVISSKAPHNRYTGHFIIGLSIINN